MTGKNGEEIARDAYDSQVPDAGGEIGSPDSDKDKSDRKKDQDTFQPFPGRSCCDSPGLKKSRTPQSQCT